MRPYITGQYQQGAFSPGQMVPAFNLDEDPYAASVVSLLHANGAQGQTTFSDSIAGITWTNTRACVIDRTTSPFHDQVAPYSIDMGASSNTISYLLSNASSSLSLGSGPYTIEGFAKLGRGIINPCLFDNRSASNVGIAIYANITAATNFGFVLYSNSTGVIVATDVPIGNTWVHWVVMRTTGGPVYLFLDGKIMNHGTDTRTYAATPSIYLGSNYTATQPLLGWMSEFRMTLAARYTLPGSIVQYQQIFTPPTLPFPNP